MGTIFIFLGLLIFGSHLFSALFSKKRIPDVLLLVIIGIIIGPIFHWVTPSMLGTIGSVFASLTLVFIMFDSGIDMSIDAIRKSWKGVVQVTFYSFLLSFAVVTGMGIWLDMEFKSSMLLGSIIASTGASIVIPLVKQLKVSDQTRVVLSLESAISAVLSIVLALSLIEGFKMDSSTVGLVIGKVLSSFLLAVVLGVIGGIFWAGILDKVRNLRNSMFLTPAFVFILYGITEALGYSGAIAALAFGIVLGNTEYFEFSFLNKFQRDKMLTLEEGEKSFFKELVFVFKTFFFVYIGICIPFTNFTALMYGLIITVALFLARFVLIHFVGKKNSPNDRLVVSMMIPKGLASAVLASMPEQVNISMGYNLIPHAVLIKHVVYAVIFFSIIITSLLVLFTRKKLVIEDLEMIHATDEPSEDNLQEEELSLQTENDNNNQ